MRRREEGREKKGKGVENDELNWMEEVMRKRKERVRRIDSETGEREGEKEKGDETRKKKRKNEYRARRSNLRGGEKTTVMWK